MFGCPDVKTAFVFAAINNNEAIKLKTINNARAKLFGNIYLKRNWLTILDGDLKTIFNLQYGNVL